MSALEPLGDRAWRLAVADADEGLARAVALRASGQVDDAWHTETHVAFVPRGDVAPATLAALPWTAPRRAPRTHVVPVALDGPDLDEVCAAAGLARDGLARLLHATTLTVSFVGFSPGFAYLRGLDPRLHLPRRASPRPRVPAGSLAVAGGFAAIYPNATPGGWHLLGRATEPMWRDGAPLLAAGDRLRFAAESAALDDTTDDRPAAPRRPVSDRALVIVELRGLAFVQDGGRTGALHQGMPPAGALRPRALARANHALGNPAGAAGLERYGALRLAATVAVSLATEDGAVHRLRPGDVLDLPWSATTRAGYVAVAGGLDLPQVLGGRGTHVRAGLGGKDGGPLRAGDRLPLGAGDGEAAARPPTATLAGSDDGPAIVRVVPGPDRGRLAADALDRLVATTWRLSYQSDRMGTRLDGPALPRAPGPADSTPLVMGAIEIPPDGGPIVLGPEHPTTGGYPVLAVIATADLERFHAIPLGQPVRFRLAR